MKYYSPIVIALSLLLLALPAGAQVGTINTVVIAGSPYTNLAGITPSGLVAGEFDGGAGRTGFVAKLGDLENRVEINLGAITKIAAIAPNGTVVGSFCDGADFDGVNCARWQGFIRERNGVVTYWSYPNPASTVPFSTILTGINGAGQIAGFYTPTSDPPLDRGFVLAGDVLTEISYGAYYKTNPQDINLYGDVVGTVCGPGLPAQCVGFVWSGGSFTTFAKPKEAGGYYVTPATGINDKGEVVGHYVDPAVGTVGYLYKYGLFTDFTCELAAYTYPQGINNKSQISGYCQNPAVGFYTMK